MREDRIACEPDDPICCPSLTPVSTFHGDAVRLHVNQQAVFTVFMINQDKVPNVLRIFFRRKLWVSNLVPAASSNQFSGISLAASRTTPLPGA